MIQGEIYGHYVYIVYTRVFIQVMCIHWIRAGVSVMVVLNGVLAHDQNELTVLMH